jgi:hypothetical protein
VFDKVSSEWSRLEIGGSMTLEWKSRERGPRARKL